MEETTLNRLIPGQRARVTRIMIGEELRRRLLSHGLTEGTCVCCLRRGPGGASALYRIRGSSLAIRSSDGGQIYVETMP